MELYKGARWPDKKSRHDHQQAVREETRKLTGVAVEEQEDICKNVIGFHPEEFWLEGCTAPCV